MPTELLLAAFLSGAAVFIGLFSTFRTIWSEKYRALAAAAASGVLVYLFVRMAGKSAGELSDILGAGVSDYPVWGEFWFRSLLFVGGLALGMGGLIFFDRLPHGGKDSLQPPENGKKVSLMIAGGCGLYHLSQGLVLGSEFAWGERALVLLLALGFGIFNASEGLSIAHPLSGVYPGFGHLFTVGLIATLPSLIGVIVGHSWNIKALEAFFLALACGVTLANIAGIFRLGRQIKPREEGWVGLGMGSGFLVAWILDLLTVARTGNF